MPIRGVKSLKIPRPQRMDIQNPQSAIFHLDRIGWSALYLRLITLAGARRVLFLADSDNLVRQTKKRFDQLPFGKVDLSQGVS